MKDEKNNIVNFEKEEKIVPLDALLISIKNNIAIESVNYFSDNYMRSYVLKSIYDKIDNNPVDTISLYSECLTSDVNPPYTKPITFSSLVENCDSLIDYKTPNRILNDFSDLEKNLNSDHNVRYIIDYLNKK